MDASKITVSIPYAINLYFIFISLERNHLLFVDKYYWKNNAHFKPIGYNLTTKIIANKILKKYVGTH
jgi:hypothetical protein